MRSQRKRIKRLENRNPQTDEPPKIERVIVDTKEQAQHPERFNKVLKHEDDTRKVFELDRK